MTTFRYEVAQLSASAMKSMAPDQIVEADRAGHLEALKRGDDPATVNAALISGGEAVVSTPAVAVTAGGGDLGARSGHAVDGDVTTRAELRRMTPDQIVKARREGRLNRLLQGNE